MVSVSFLCSLLVLSVNLVFSRRVGVMELNVSFYFGPFFSFYFFLPSVLWMHVSVLEKRTWCVDFININMFSCDSDE